MSKLTVVIPNYNHAKYLPDCLDAIFSQSVQPLEVIVIDDASQDDSKQVIQAYAQRYPLLHYLQNSENLGVIRTVNRGIELAKGDCLAFCAADDISLPGFFEAATNVLKRHSEVGFCCADSCEFYDVQPYQFRRLFLGIKREFQIIQPDQLMNLLKRTNFWIPSHSTIYRKELVLKYGRFNPFLGHLCDWYLNYQIALRHPLAYLPYPFGALRIVKDSYARSMRRKKKERNLCFQELLDCIDRENLSPHFLKTGLLGQVGIQMIIYLSARPKYWKFLPRSFKMKCIHFYNRYLSPKSA